MAKLLAFAAGAKRGSCLCQRRLRQARNGLQLIATGAEVPGERISVLRFPCPRPSSDEKRDGRATFHLHAGERLNSTIWVQPDNTPSLQTIEARRRYQKLCCFQTGLARLQWE